MSESESAQHPPAAVETRLLDVGEVVEGPTLADSQAGGTQRLSAVGVVAPLLDAAGPPCAILIGHRDAWL